MILPVSCAAVAGLVWLMVRSTASLESHRRHAAAYVLSIYPLATLIRALGLVDPRGTFYITLLVATAAAIEAAQCPPSTRVPFAKPVQFAWSAMWVAVVGLQLIAAANGAAPGLPEAILFVCLAVLWWVRIDEELVSRVAIPVWTGFSILTFALIPFGVTVGGTEASDPLSDERYWALEETSPYSNFLTEVLGLGARWAGLFGHPNQLGYWAALGFGLALSGRRPSMTLLASSTVLLLLSSSRTSQLAALAGVAVFTLSRSRGRTRLLALSAMSVLALVTVRSLTLDESARTATGRTELWAQVPGLLDEKWLSGLGPGAGKLLVDQGLLPPWGEHMHSLIYETLLLSGVLGLVITAFFVAALALSSLRGRQSLPLAVALAVLALANNYNDLYSLTMGVLGYVLVLGADTRTTMTDQGTPSAVQRPRRRHGHRPSTATPSRTPNSGRNPSGTRESASRGQG